ncbi:hypothetical protein KUCAC02_024423 [Chaenocephalus aceratus]|uniref:Uncharacterized protein n=1 Tax=Chaenocephalus aceratus TaxID=36190 RepID=A0ACB9WJH8_CHAAC|nr:hypothetical protein KUCAC02_024423 [Chaenocephalus aceratus]
MQRNQRPKPGPNATDSPEEDKAGSAEPLPDIQAIMAALKRTEQCVLTKIDSTVTAAVVEDVRKENTTFVTRIEGLEEGANCYANRVVELEAKVTTLSSQVNKLVDKTEDLESRQRRDNCRLVGVAEGTGNIQPEKAIAQLLQDALSLDYTPTLDRAHRGCSRNQLMGMPQGRSSLNSTTFRRKQILYGKPCERGPSSTTASVSTSTRTTRSRHTLKSQTSAGEQKSFEDPTKAKHYIETDLHPREPGGRVIITIGAMTGTVGAAG